MNPLLVRPDLFSDSFYFNTFYFYPAIYAPNTQEIGPSRAQHLPPLSFKDFTYGEFSCVHGFPFVAFLNRSLTNDDTLCPLRLACALIFRHASMEIERTLIVVV